MKIKALILVLLVLVTIFVISKLYDGKKGESTLLTDLIEVDTADISGICFYPQSYDKKELKLHKVGNEWKLSYDDKTVTADQNAIKSILTELDGLKPKRLVSNSEEKWEKYELTDSLGTSIRIESNGEIVTSLMLGKFNYNEQTRTGVSFVRLTDDTKVYSTDGFISMAFNREPNTFRNRSLIQAESNDWTRITFNYPADSSFTLSSNNGTWMLDGLQVDSMTTANYVSSLSRLGGNDFIDDDFNSTMAQPDYTITIEGANQSIITLDAYNIVSLNDIAIVSSQNIDSKFSGNSGDIFKRTFVSKHKFVQ